MSSAHAKPITKAQKLLTQETAGRGRENVLRFSPAVKSVTFSAEIIETSIGGTQTIGEINSSPAINIDDANNSSQVNADEHTPLRSIDVNVKVINSTSDSVQKSLTATFNIDSPVITKDNEMKNVFSYATPKKNGRRNTVDARENQLDAVGLDSPLRRHTLEGIVSATPDCYNVVQMETPIHPDSSYNGAEKLVSPGEDSCSLTVAVRVRPYSQRELLDPNARCVVEMSNNETRVLTEGGHLHNFSYDFSFWSFDQDHGFFAGQEKVYKLLAQPLLSKAFEGYNTCLFAYGQTGSGKSYCIMGHGSEVGIIPRYCEELFDRAQFITRRENVRMNMEISFFEIYNEKIHDLLASSKEKGGKKETLKVREHPVLGPYVEGLSTYVVNSFEDVEGWISLGNKNRATAATGMNDKSSRSHSVFTLVLTQTRSERIDGKDDEHCITSKINLVDLAGSERQSQAKTTGERLREGANINKSLLTLGKVISVLSERSTNSNKKKRIFIPYRDSVLTWLLRESLGGNSKTAMLATISPSNDHIEETLSTLRYAQQARSIVNVVRVNEDPKARIIRELCSEIGRLRSVLGMSADVTQAAHLVENMTLKDQLRAKEREMEAITRSWQERLRLAEERKQEEAEILKRSGVTFKVDNGLPYFVNLNEDSQLSEMLLYVIKDGQTRVGRTKDGSNNDIQLNGGLIADSHCIINNSYGIVSITPIADAPTYVNGELVTSPTIIQHGDRLVLGGNHFFRLNHRLQEEASSNSAGQVKDFEFARKELLDIQEAKLQKELEEVRKQTEKEMQERVETARKQAEEELRHQRTGYEGRLAEMEQALHAQSLVAREVAPLQHEVEELTEKLKKQKKTMEQEIQNGKLRQEIEAEEKVAIPVSSEKSRLLELLESEREKAVQRLEHLRQRRNEMMNLLHRPSPPEAATNVSKTGLFRITLLVREANKISQYLRKHLSFSQDTLINNNLAKKMIRVTNTKLNICTHWSLEKFENRLCQMRDLFENESDSSTDDEVFSDPSDMWDKEERFCSPKMSPGVLSGCRRYSNSPGSSLRQSMASSVSSMGCRGSFRRSDSESSSSYSKSAGTPLVSLCKNLVQDTLERFQEPNREHTIADKILHSCESLKQSILLITDRPNEVSSSDAASATSMHLSHGLQQVMCYANCWAMMYDHLDSTHISDLVRRLRDKVKAIGNCTSYFLQGCENGLESLIQETGNNLQDSVLVVCRICGELALSTDTAVTSLDEGEDREEGGKLGSDVCQAFLGGCDEFIDKALQGGLKTLEDFETKAQDYVDRTAPSLILGEVPKHVEIVVATTKILLLKCQEIQVEVDSSLREGMDNKPAQYYGVCFTRLQALITHISGLVDGVTLLMQATSQIAEGEDKDIGKVCRCVEIIQKAADRLLLSSNRESIKVTQSVSDTDVSETSVLSDSQMELLDYAVQEVKLATSTLNQHAQRVLDTSDSNSTMSPTRIKRILPVSPDQSSVTPKFTYPRRAAPRNISLMKNGSS